MIVPKEYVGAVMELCNERRGSFDHMEYLSEERVHLVYELPLGEIVLDFYDQLKSRTRGYASFDYDLAGFREGDLVRVDVLVGGEPVDALSLIIHRDVRLRARQAARRAAAEGDPAPVLRRRRSRRRSASRVIARETVKAKRKDVLAKCYGGDITRKRKLLEKQKKGKKRMKQVGAVEVPQEAFLAVLNLDWTGERDGTQSTRNRHPRVRKSPVRFRKGASSPPWGELVRERATSTCTCRSARTAAATATSSRSRRDGAAG